MIITHLWSEIAVEFKFYALWPFKFYEFINRLFFIAKIIKKKTLAEKIFSQLKLF